MIINQSKSELISCESKLKIRSEELNSKIFIEYEAKLQHFKEQTANEQIEIQKLNNLNDQLNNSFKKEKEQPFNTIFKLKIKTNLFKNMNILKKTINMHFS
jgi:hypothetical protein